MKPNSRIGLLSVFIYFESVRDIFAFHQTAPYRILSPILHGLPVVISQLIIDVKPNNPDSFGHNRVPSFLLPQKAQAEYFGLSFEPNEIKLKDLQKKQEKKEDFLVTVFCSKSLTKNVCVDVINKSDGQIVGKLNIVKNDEVYNLPIKIVKVCDNLFPISIPINLEQVLKEKSFNQSLKKQI